MAKYEIKCVRAVGKTDLSVSFNLFGCYLFALLCAFLFFALFFVNKKEIKPFVKIN